ncbi:MAG: class I SAM-dependent methyltransferase [Gemmatimonadota bacterium]
MVDIAGMAFAKSRAQRYRWNSMDIAAIRQIREREFRQVQRLVAPAGKGKLLEIGAGAGWQAKALAESGLDVVAIDVGTSEYGEARVFPVLLYDGKHIPLDDASVDVVFSSNVLEHVPHVRAFQDEIARVLQPNGFAVHMMPTTSWRVWTSVAHYVHIVKWLYGRVAGASPAAGAPVVSGETPAVVPPPGGKLTRLLRLAFPYSHGEIASPVSELWLFNKLRWTRLFQQAGWTVEHVESNDLFYTGYLVFGSQLAMAQRESLSALLGGSCNAYVVRPPNRIRIPAVNAAAVSP